MIYEILIINYKRIMSKSAIIMIVPTVRYTPPLITLSSRLIERTSLRISFFSDDFNFDISMALISSNLDVKALTSDDSPGSGGFVTTREEGSVVVDADD